MSSLGRDNKKVHIMHNQSKYQVVNFVHYQETKIEKEEHVPQINDNESKWKSRKHETKLQNMIPKDLNTFH